MSDELLERIRQLQQTIERMDAHNVELKARNRDLESRHVALIERVHELEIELLEEKL